MAATLAQILYGMALTYCATSSGTYVPIGAIEDFKPGKVSYEVLKIVRNDAPTIYGEKITGWADVSDYEVTVTYDKTQYALLNTLVNSPQYWKFLRPDTTSTTAFYAVITELGDETPMKGGWMKASFKMTVSGGQTFTHS